MTDPGPMEEAAIRMGEAVGSLRFISAVDDLRKLNPADRRPGTTGPVSQETVLFRAAASLGFPPGEIAGIAPRPATDPPSWPVEMEVAFLGLYGPSSPMPAFWTERIVQDTDGAQNLRDFLDLFDHPLIGLLHRIHQHNQIHLQIDASLHGPVPTAVMALVGQIGGTALARAMDWTRLLPYCGLLAISSVSVEALIRVLSGYFEIPVEVEEWVPRMIPIPEDQRFTLGNPEAGLGFGTVIGESVPDVSGAARLVLGPLPRAVFETFLPNGSRREELRALLTVAVRKPIAIFVDLLLDPEEAAGLVLGEGQLGWTTWQAGGDDPPRCPTGLI